MAQFLLRFKLRILPFVYIKILKPMSQKSLLFYSVLICLQHVKESSLPYPKILRSSMAKHIWIRLPKSSSSASDRAIIHWDSFSIAQDEVTKISFPAHIPPY
jgi:hypothetical protein